MFIKSSVVSVSKSDSHSMRKNHQAQIKLIKGFGLEGDVHAGAIVKHRSRVKKYPNLPNLRQVHLIHSELYQELADKGFVLDHGEMGENITTTGLDLLSLPQGAILKIGPTSKIEITGLRNPCYQLDDIQKGLMKAVLDRKENGDLIRKTGVMAIVLSDGYISVGDDIEVILPPGEHRSLECV